MSSKVETDRDGALEARTETVTLHNLYHDVLRSFQHAWKLGGCAVCLDASSSSATQEYLSLLYMWAQGLDLHQFERLADENFGLRQRVASLLLGIKHIVQSGKGEVGAVICSPPCNRSLQCHIKANLRLFFLVDGYAIADAEEARAKFKFTTCINDADQGPGIFTNSGIHEEEEPDSSSEDGDSDCSSCQEGEDRALQKVHRWHRREIGRLGQKCHNLMDLLPTIENYIDIDQVQSNLESVPSISGRDALSPAEPLVRQIQDKFPKIDSVLARRLGEAGLERFFRIRRVLHSTKNIEPEEKDEAYDENESAGPEEIEPSAFVPVSSFYDSGLGASIKTKSRYTPSNTSHTSFLSTQSMKEGVYRVPPTPIEVSQGIPFICDYCNQTVTNIQNRIHYK